MTERNPKLRTWGQVARYLGVSVDTAQRWKRDHGLPVRKGPGRTMPVIADPADLDQWEKSQFRIPPQRACA